MQYLQELTSNRQKLYEKNSNGRNQQNRSTVAMQRPLCKDSNLNDIFSDKDNESSEEKFCSPIKSENQYTGMENRRLVEELKLQAGSHIGKRKNADQAAMQKLKEQIEADNKLTNPERQRPKTQSEQNMPTYLQSNLTRKGSVLARGFIKMIEKNRNLQGMSEGVLSHEERDLLDNKKKINQCKPETQKSFRTAKQQKMSSKFIRGLKQKYFERTNDNDSKNIGRYDGHIKEQLSIHQQSSVQSINDSPKNSKTKISRNQNTFSQDLTRNPILLGPLSNNRNCINRCSEKRKPCLCAFWQCAPKNFIKKRRSLPKTPTLTSGTRAIAVRNRTMHNFTAPLEKVHLSESEKSLSVTRSEKKFFRLKKARELLVDRTPMMLGKYPLAAYMKKPQAALDDPDAPDYMKISHMPRYKLKQKNEPWMKQMDSFREDCKDRLHYYQLQINELPEGKGFAEKLLSSEDFKEGIFGKDLKHADARSLKMYNDHVSTFKLMSKQLCTDPPVATKVKAMWLSKLRPAQQKLLQKRKGDMVNKGMRRFGKVASKQKTPDKKDRIEEEEAIKNELNGLRDEQRERLKEKYELSIGRENCISDYKLLDQVNEGDLKNAALTMSATEDTAVFKRMLDLKSRKLVQYLAVFFAGQLQTQECIMLKQKIGRGLEEVFLKYGYDASLSKVQVDMKSTVLNHCQSEDNSGQLLRLLANEIAAKVQFYDSLKETNDCGNIPFTGIQLSAEDLDMIDAKRSFISELNKHIVTMLPLLLKVKEQRLVLRCYQINPQLCMGLQCAFIEYPMMIKQLRLESNNVSDESFAILLKGLVQQDYITSVTYAKNEFGDKSVKALIPLLEKRNQLRELNIQECKVRKNVCTDLFQVIQNFDNLESLSITNAKMSPMCIPYLKEYLSKSCRLHTLDISWNGLRAQQMLELCEVVGENRFLKYLNLSNNTLVNPSEHKWSLSNEREAAKYYKETVKAKETNKNAIRELRRKGLTVPHELLYPPKPATIHSKSVAYLCTFIKQNKKLLHLDLSYMGLDEETLLMFGRAVRRCKSMVSFHLTGNPGNCDSARKAFAKRIHCKQWEEPFVLNFAEIARQEQGAHWWKNIEESMSNSDGERMLGEAESLKQVLIERKTHKCVELKSERNVADMLIFERKLGLKTEMPGSGQWNMVTSSRQMDRRCWCCNLHRYTLVFWTSEIGFTDQKKHSNDLAFEDAVYEIEQREKQSEADGYCEQVTEVPNISDRDLLERPKIFGAFNNWRGQRMYRVEDLCFLLDKQRPDLVEEMRKKRRVRKNVETLDQMNEAEKINYLQAYSKYTRRSYGTRKAWRKCLANSTFFKEPALVDLDRVCRKKAKFMKKELHLKPNENVYGSGSDTEYSEDKPRYVVSDTEESEAEEVVEPKRKATKNLVEQVAKTQQEIDNYSRSQIYVAPMVLPPGRHFYVVKGQVMEGQEDNCDVSLGSQVTGNIETQYFHHTMHVRPRQEPIPWFKKQIKRVVTTAESFSLSDSVFKDWKQPTRELYAKFIAYDIKHWKVKKFEKDPRVLKEVEALFINNIEKLYNIYIEVAAGSNFPLIKWLAWAEFASLLYDEGEIEGEIVDRIFTGVKSDVVGDGFYRYHFFEAIVRLAKAKYQVTSRVETLGDAVRKLFFEDIFSEKGPSTTSWPSFRFTQLYQKDANAVFFANLKGLTRLFSKHGESFQPTHSKQDCIDLMCKTRVVLGYEKEAIHAFGLAKMPVFKDRDKKGKEQNNKVNFVEFLEFIGRTASMAFRSQAELTFVDRLKLTIDQILDIIGLDRLDEMVVVDEESYSDDEY